MNIEVKILRNEQGKPAGKLADAEINFIAGELAGLKLVGFTVWERRDGNGRRVTFPGRPLIVHGDKRNFELLRAIGNPNVLDNVRDLVLRAYEQQVQDASRTLWPASATARRSMKRQVEAVARRPKPARARNGADGDVSPVERAGPMRPQGRKGNYALSARDGQAHSDRRRLRGSRRLDPLHLPAPLFVLAQTEGVELPPIATPAWDANRALAALEVTEVPFDTIDGNVLGFARGRSIAVSPINPLPHKTCFDELAHVLLGHTTETDQHDGELPPRNLRECEAEAVALVCCATLDLPGVDCDIQNWWGAG